MYNKYIKVERAASNSELQSSQTVSNFEKRHFLACYILFIITSVQNISESSVNASLKDKRLNFSKQRKNPKNPPFWTLPRPLSAMKYKKNVKKGSSSKNNNHKKARRAITHKLYHVDRIIISIDLPGPEIINSTCTISEQQNSISKIIKY